MTSVRTEGWLVAASWLLTGCHLIGELDELSPPLENPGLDVRWVKTFGGTGFQNISRVETVGDDTIILAGTFQGTLELGDEEFVNTGSMDVVVAALNASGDVRWARAFESDDVLDISDLVVTTNGEIYLAGTFRGTLVIDEPLVGDDPGVDAAWMAKLDAAGNVVWARASAGSGAHRGDALALTALHRIGLVGTFERELVLDDERIDSNGGEDIFIAWLDANDGDVVSLQGYGDEEHQRVAAAVDWRANVVVAGTSYGSLQFGDDVIADTGSGGPFIVNLSESGRLLWGSSFSDDDRNCHEWCEQELALGAGERILYTGAYTGGITLGDETLYGAFGADVFVYALEPDGFMGEPRPAWGGSFGDIAEQRPTALVDLDGTTVVAGRFTGEIDLGGGALTNTDFSHDIFVGAFDEDGEHVFSFALPNTHPRRSAGSPSIAPLEGGLVIGGRFIGDFAIGDQRFESDSSNMFLAYVKP